LKIAILSVIAARRVPK